MTTLHTLRLRYREALDVLIDNKSNEYHRRMARKQLAYCERVIPVLEKAMPQA